MKYSIFEYKHGRAGLTNTGDHIQSLAAKQFLPKVDFYVERDALNKDDYEICKIIMNGWYTHKPENWPPNPNLKPLFLSFHLNPAHASKLLDKEENVEYLKKHGPIGCRDYSTLNILTKYGIPSYYSSCLTTTLDLKYKSEIKNDEIHFVDILYGYDMRFLYKADPRRFIYHLFNGKLKKHLNLKKKNAIINRLIPKDIQKKAIKSGVYTRANLSTDKLYEIAEEKLSKYAKAKLVVTSRIHCALPCIALGTPVLFILDGLENYTMDISRFDGILDHINILSDRPKSEIDILFGKEMNVIHPKDIDWNNPPKNPSSYLKYANEMKAKCIDFINS